MKNSLLKSLLAIFPMLFFISSSYAAAQYAHCYVQLQMATGDVLQSMSVYQMKLNDGACTTDPIEEGSLITEESVSESSKGVATITISPNNIAMNTTFLAVEAHNRRDHNKSVDACYEVVYSSQNSSDNVFYFDARGNGSNKPNCSVDVSVEGVQNPESLVKVNAKNTAKSETVIYLLGKPSSTSN